MANKVLNDYKDRDGNQMGEYVTRKELVELLEALSGNPNNGPVADFQRGTQRVSN